MSGLFEQDQTNLILQPAIMKLFDAPAPNPMAVRLFVLKRGGLDIDVENVYIDPPEPTSCIPHNQPPWRSPSTSTKSPKMVHPLFGETPKQRAEIRMWLRRMDLEICQPLFAWFRNDPATLD